MYRAGKLRTQASSQTAVTAPPAKEKEQVLEVWRTMGMLRDDCRVCCRLNT